MSTGSLQVFWSHDMIRTLSSLVRMFHESAELARVVKLLRISVSILPSREGSASDQYAETIHGLRLCLSRRHAVVFQGAATLKNLGSHRPSTVASCQERKVDVSLPRYLRKPRGSPLQFSPVRCRLGDCIAERALGRNDGALRRYCSERPRSHQSDASEVRSSSTSSSQYFGSGCERDRTFVSQNGPSCE